jgi:GNAT superfamily N-acetyltransferase
MTAVTYRRLDLLLPADLAICQNVFRRAPSFVYPTGGRPATDEDVSEMLNRVPAGVSATSLHVVAIEMDGASCGFYALIRGYPDAGTTYLALLLLIEESQGRALGTQALKQIEAEAKSWGCTALFAAVDSRNERALHFWLRRGFVEEFRRAAPVAGFMGDAIGTRKYEL